MCRFDLGGSGVVAAGNRSADANALRLLHDAVVVTDSISNSVDGWCWLVLGGHGGEQP
jgi:hypothetical protein